MTAIVACAAVVGLSAGAQARPQLVMLKGVMVNGKMVSKRIEPAKTTTPSLHSYTYSFSVDVPSNTKTIVTGWALIDQTTCTELSSGSMNNNGPVRGTYGKWNIGKYTEPGYICANGGSINAVFGSSFYTWTHKKAAAGTTDKRTTVWKARSFQDGGKFVINNNNTAIYSGS